MFFPLWDRIACKPDFLYSRSSYNVLESPLLHQEMAIQETHVLETLVSERPFPLDRK